MNIAVLGAKGAIGRACIQELASRGIGAISLDSEDAIPEGIDTLILAVPQVVATSIRFDGILIDCSRAALETQLSLPRVLDVVAKRKRTPNCMASLIAQAVIRLHNACTITNIITTTMQCASGAGWRGVLALDEHETVDIFKGHLMCNVLPHETASCEEDAISQDLHALLGCKVTATAFRVPVRVGHVASVRVETVKPIDATCLPESQVFDPRSMEGHREVAIGRVRIEKNIANFVVCGDQILCGTVIPAIDSIFFP